MICENKQLTKYVIYLTQVTVTDGSFGGLDGLDPSISWSAESSSGDVDLEVSLFLMKTRD